VARRLSHQVPGATATCIAGRAASSWRAERRHKLPAGECILDGNGERQTFLWRILVTGVCFVLFGIGGLILGLVVFPAVLLWPGKPARRRARTRGLVQLAFRAFVTVMSASRGLSYDFQGRERLGRPGQLIIANHPTLIDVVFIVAFTPAPACVVKVAIFNNPFTRMVVRAAGYIRNAPTDAMIEQAMAALASGDALVMFPEGTRTRPGQPMHFHRGAASVAVQGAAVLTPIYISVDQPFLHKAQPWYRVPRRRPHLTFRVGDDVDLEPYRHLPAPKASRQLNAWLLAHYEGRLGDPRRL
jgi:1-acyl-sn-glycerol-3-phosphate acyltransferase